MAQIDPLAAVRACVQAIEEDRPVITYSPSRWPYTYAWDYVRSHWGVFRPLLGRPPSHISEPLGVLLSRSDVAQLIARLCQGDEQQVSAVAARLAAAYMRENRIVPPDADQLLP